MPMRAAVRASPTAVAEWLDAHDMSGSVTPGLSATTFVDLMPLDVADETSEDWASDAFDAMASDLETSVLSVSGFDQVLVHEPGQVASPTSLEDVTYRTEHELLSELLDAEMRLSPPFGRQVLIMSTPSEDNWSIAKAVLGVDLVTVRLDGWSVVVAPGEDLVPPAHGLVAPGKESAFLVSRHEDSWACIAFRRGKPRTAHLRFAGARMVGLDRLDPELLEDVVEPMADAELLVRCADTAVARENVTLLRALLRREATASSPIELVRLFGLGEAGDLATAVLEGRDLADDARAEASEASSWSWRALASLVSRGEMSAEEVPWISIVYALWLILLVPLAVENVSDWAGATLDGWDVAQLVGCAISIPVSLVALVRVVFWMRLRRRSIP